MTVSPNTRLGRYEIRSKLGAGGMGEVYLAQDAKLDRKVALKILPADVAANHDRMRRFVQEAKAASALNHPNIITIHEIDEADSIHFIATEFVEGLTLRKRIQTAPMKPDEVIDVAAQIASALATAHAAGIIHRDVKPENVMLRRDGIVKVLDFGLVKLVEAAPSEAVDSNAPTRVDTESRVVMGTPRYMSPEQARGIAVDARTDIYSLGLLIYEMATRRLPFEGSYTNEVPAELQRIIAKALRTNRDERYQTIKDLLLDLKALRQNLEFERQSGATSATTKIKKRATVFVFAAVVAVALTAGAYFYLVDGRREVIRSVAVLPLTNVNAEADTDYLSDGITDNLIERLSRLPDLKVMAHTAVFHYKGRQTDALAVGRELGVEAVLTGRVVKRNDALTINLELVDARDNRHIWGEQYDEKVSDLMALQREIPVDVSERLRLRLNSDSKERLTRLNTRNAEAYQLYLKGLYSWEKWTVDGSKQAVEYFGEAIKKDPNYALAYSGLASVYLFGSGVGPEVSQKEAHRRAREAATKALSLDPQLGEAHAALAEVLLYDDWDFSNAEKELKRAIDLSPSYAEAHHQYSHLLLVLGRIEESFAESKKLLEVDPVSETPIGHLAYHYLHARQFDEAIRQFNKDLQLYPDATEHGLLGEAYYEKGMFREAAEEYLKGFAQNGVTPDQLAALTAAFDKSGIKGFLRKDIERIKGGAQTPLLLARDYARLGEKDQAIEWLEKAYMAHSDGLVRLKEELAFDPLRSDPRFVALVRRVGLPE